MPRNSQSGPSARPTRDQQLAIDLVAALPSMKVAELNALWPRYFQVEPFSIHKHFLIQCLAYRIQEIAFGGLSRSVRNRLESVTRDLEAGRKPSILPKKGIRLGTRLLRSWHGDVHEVTVVGDGFLYRAKTYSSLSEIARTITGVQWSGPLFFGLKKSQDKAPAKAAS